MAGWQIALAIELGAIATILVANLRMPRRPAPFPSMLTAAHADRARQLRGVGILLTWLDLGLLAAWFVYDTWQPREWVAPISLVVICVSLLCQAWAIRIERPGPC